MEQSKRRLNGNQFVFVDSQKAGEETIVNIIGLQRGNHLFEYQGDREDVVKVKNPEVYGKIQLAIDAIADKRIIEKLAIDKAIVNKIASERKPSNTETEKPKHHQKKPFG